MQERFRHIVKGFPSLVQTANRMIDAGTRLNIPIVVTEQNSDKLGHTVEEINIRDAHLIQAKMKFSMLTPEISLWLNKRPEIKSVVIFGIEAHVCILQTVLDLLENGYDVTILADGVASRNNFDLKLALLQMRQWGATVVSSESLLFKLMETASHEQFRNISALVKESIVFPHDEL